MIIQIRVDARLIHGQVVLGWTRELNTPRIIVVDDDAATTDKVTYSTLHMGVQAAGGGLKLWIKTLADAIPLINDPRMDDYRVFLITRYMEVAWEIVRQCPGKVLAVNCANIGFHKEDIPEAEQIKVDRYICNQSDVDCMNHLANTPGLDVFHQITPTYKKEMIIDYLKGSGVYKPE